MEKNNVFQEPNVNIANWLPNKIPLPFLSTLYRDFFFFPIHPSGKMILSEAPSSVYHRSPFSFLDFEYSMKIHMEIAL